MHIPTRWIDSAEVDKAVGEFLKTLGPEVVRVRYNIGEDWTGDPALYFRIVLAGGVSADRKSFSDAAQRIRDTLFERLKPLEMWGPSPHASFRPNPTTSSMIRNGCEASEYHVELLGLAMDVVDKPNPNQADLRRAHREDTGGIAGHAAHR